MLPYRWCEAKHGAGGRNRTDIASLEGWSFTTKLHPLAMLRLERLTAMPVKSGFEIRSFAFHPVFTPVVEMRVAGLWWWRFIALVQPS
jgi:hypothetical protein